MHGLAAGKGRVAQQGHGPADRGVVVLCRVGRAKVNATSPGCQRCIDNLEVGRVDGAVLRRRLGATGDHEVVCSVVHWGKSCDALSGGR